MEFFKSLNQTNIKNITLDIHFNDGIATVCVVPKNTSKDNALNQLKALIITKEIELIDAIFFDRINQPLINTQLAFDNALDYQTKLENQTKYTQEKKALKDELDKHTNKLKKLMENDPLDEKNTKSARDLVNKIKIIDPKSDYANSIQNQLSQGGLF